MENDNNSQVERIIVWYYRNSGCRINRFESVRIKLWYFFESGTWIKAKLRNV